LQRNVPRVKPPPLPPRVINYWSIRILQSYPLAVKTVREGERDGEGERMNLAMSTPPPPAEHHSRCSVVYH